MWLRHTLDPRRMKWPPVGSALADVVRLGPRIRQRVRQGGPYGDIFRVYFNWPSAGLVAGAWEINWTWLKNGRSGLAIQASLILSPTLRSFTAFDTAAGVGGMMT